MNNLNHLLAQLSLIKKEYDIARDKQEKFNIFTVLHKPHDERRLHSRFIATLLNPIASHGFNNEFLKLFFALDFVKLNIESFKDAVVYPEEWNKVENSNIDILIIDRSSRHAIIIENKIFAMDSNGASGGQLERYFKYIRDSEKIPVNNIHVFYLTLDGHKPSQDSLGEFKTLENINGKLLSYNNELITWLEECLKLTVEKPFIRESIIQYIKLIKQLTMNEAEISECLKIKDLIAVSQQNMDATKYLIDNFNHIKCYTIAEFWEELTIKVDEIYHVTDKINSKSIDIIAYSGLNKSEEEDGIYFNFNKDNRGLIYHSPNDALWFGFQIDKVNDYTKQKLEKLVENKTIFKGNVHYYFYFQNSKGDFLYLKNFSDLNTFNLINPEIRSKTIGEIVHQIVKFIQDNLM